MFDVSGGGDVIVLFDVRFGRRVRKMGLECGLPAMGVPKQSDTGQMM